MTNPEIIELNRRLAATDLPEASDFEKAVWAEWAVTSDRCTAPVHQIAHELGATPADVAFIVYPAETFGPWSDDQEPHMSPWHHERMEFWDAWDLVFDGARPQKAVQHFLGYDTVDRVIDLLDEGNLCDACGMFEPPMDVTVPVAVWLQYRGLVNVGEPSPVRATAAALDLSPEEVHDIIHAARCYGEWNDTQENPLAE